MTTPKGKKKNIVISGLGVISSLGIAWENFWNNLTNGKSGINKVSLFDTEQYDRHLAGEVQSFEPEEFIDKRKVKKFGRSSQMAIAAVKLALHDANFPIKELSTNKIAISIGTTMGEALVVEEIVQGYTNKSSIESKQISALSYPTNAITGNVAREFGIDNKNTMFANACAAGNYAISHGYDLIQAGKADIVVAGGVDALSRIAFTGFSRLFAMAPEKCQPFDKNRKGMMVGEGAGIVILESLESAQNRGAPIYAEILGYGMSCDAHHMTNPSVNGIVKAMKKALKDADVSYKDIDYICAHGTGTKENDKVESQAIYEVFNGKADSIPVSSIKSMLGHTMGAAAALETIACCLAIKNQKIPPTINYQELDPECVINCVPNKSIKSKINVVMNNSQAFGGNNAVMILSKRD